MPPQDPIATNTDTAPMPPLTMGKFKASKMIALQSWGLLKKDKEIMWFPVLSGLTSLVALVLFGIVLFFVTLGGQLSNIGHLDQGNVGAFSYVVLFLYYLVMYFITNFFLSGIYIIAHGRLSGQDLTFRDGINGALENSGKIFWWSFISATVGVVLQIIADRSKLIGRIVVMVLGAAWAILTYFSLPSLVIGKTSITGSFKQSASVIRKTWGETIIVNLGLGLFSSLFVLAAIVVTIGVILLAPTTMVILGMGILFFVFMLFFILITSSLDAIFKLALYEYAVTGKAPEGFSPELIQHAIKTK